MENFIRNKVTTFNDVLKKVEDYSSSEDYIFNISCKKYYVFGEKSILHITLIDDVTENCEKEYLFEFISPSTPTVLYLPYSIDMIDGNMNIMANKRYLVSIIDNKCAIVHTEI